MRLDKDLQQQFYERHRIFFERFLFTYEAEIHRVQYK